VGGIGGGGLLTTLLLSVGGKKRSTARHARSDERMGRWGVASLAWTGNRQGDGVKEMPGR